MTKKHESKIAITPAKELAEIVKQSSCRDIGAEFDRLIGRLLNAMTTVSEGGHAELTIGLTDAEYIIKYTDYDRERLMKWEYPYLDKLRGAELSKIIGTLHTGLCTSGYIVEDVTGLPADNINVGVVFQISWGYEEVEVPVEPWYNKIVKLFKKP